MNVITTTLCITCRSGRCERHGVLKYVAYTGPRQVIPEESMVEIGCCDRYEGEYRRRRAQRAWRYCPWCGSER